MPYKSASRDSSSRSKRFNPKVGIDESWRQFYDTVGDVIGRGGAGKVFRIRLKRGNYLHERKSSVPACLPAGEFGQSVELINDVPDDRSLAVKIIRRFRCGRDSIEKIRNEIKLIRTLQSSNVDACAPSAAAPILFSVHEDLTQVAIVMEFAEGGSLFDLCSPTSFNRPPLPSGDGTFTDGNILRSKIPESYVSSVLSKIVDALAFMHEKANIVHLDIKVCLIRITFTLLFLLSLISFQFYVVLSSHFLTALITLAPFVTASSPTSALYYAGCPLAIFHCAENILLRKPYPSSDVFITDFGLASVLNKVKPHKELAGTPDYTGGSLTCSHRFKYQCINYTFSIFCVSVHGCENEGFWSLDFVGESGCGIGTRIMLQVTSSFNFFVTFLRSKEWSLLQCLRSNFFVACIEPAKNAWKLGASP
ncbi:unnamed protein product [Hydatigera taeniaeformis]|uniref:Protein kinase domain-containing protein n=1 Tax=Hydatigena taeniaeformis TaxID=6205 RepID=A0A158RF46_HYDTA|nr:unnamed protein product [Hydatigera taeniaeformis]